MGNRLVFEVDDKGLLVRAGENVPQIVVPYILKDCILHVTHYAKLADHREGRKLYYLIRQNFYWPAQAIDCYATVGRCPHCARNRINLRQNFAELQLLPAEAPLESVCVDILVEFIKT